MHTEPEFSASALACVADTAPIIALRLDAQLRFMDRMFHACEPEVLVQTALWVFRADRAHGLQTSYWPANLDTFVEIVRVRMSATAFVQLYPFLHWLIVNIPSFVQLSDARRDGSLPAEPRHATAETAS
jgi:hypothetical protein